jgi:hypothetical protein
MEKDMSDEQLKNTPKHYAIKVHGHLDTKWSEWFYGMSITHEQDGNTTLCGPIPDQIVLHSVLDRIRDMNLQLISVNQTKSDALTNRDEDKGINHEEE